jgi:hypothetical protein
MQLGLLHNGECRNLYKALAILKSKTPQWAKNVTRIRQTKMHPELWDENLLQIGSWKVKGRGRI